MSIEHVFTALSLQDGINPAVGQEFMASMKGRVEESEVSWQQNSEIGNCATFLPPTKVVSLQRQSNGFGFTLRHFVVYPPELLRRSSETGVTPVNGLDNHVDDNERQKGEPMDTVFVRQVAPSGPADKAGLSTGDQVVSVNGHPVVGRSYAQVIQLIQSSQESLELGIIPKEDCVLQMVTPAISGPPRVTGSVQELSQTPPPVKPKPTIRRMSNQETSGRVMSTVTINPANTCHLKLSDKASESSTSSCSDSPVASVILRRGSVDRTAMENRSFVITSENVDYNSNFKSRSSGAMEGGSMHSPPMEGSYFVTTTDSTGRPCALHFEKGSKYGNTLPLVEDGRGKNRSLSFSAVELQGVGAQRPSNENYDDTVNKNDAYRPGDIYRTENISGGKPINGGATYIPPFTLSAPRTTVSDGPSTTYVNTNSDVGFRQPVAIDPGYRRTRPSYEESTSHLIRTIASHMKKDRQGPLKSSTVGTTLLESQDSQHQRQQSGGGKGPTIESTSDVPQDLDFSHPAKVRKQSNELLKHETYSSQVSMVPNKPAYEEMVLTSSFGAENDKVGPTMPAKQGSPKPRRVSYLMATSGPGGASKPPDQKVWGTAPQGRKSGKPTVMEGLTTVLQPSMVHVSSGMELCEDSGVEGMGMPSDQHAEDEVFQCASEEKNTDGSGTQRSNRRISYVMATSSPTSPRHQASLDAMKENVEEENREAVPGLEVCKEGLLWRKLTAVDGGKIFQRSSAKSWKLVFAVLRGHILCLYKDEASAHQEDITEEQPISIKSSIVDIAHDYTKKKNVFRMTTFNGSGYLFQAEDHDSMMSWISAIQANNNPDEDENGVSSQSLIIRRMKTMEQETSGSNSLSPSHKLTPPSTTKMPSLPGISNIKKGISFRSITTGQKGESGKNHGHKASKKRKKPPATAATTTTYPPGHSVGVPLEMCPPSKQNKFVPLIVEHCCDVVERKGLESVGVYRVPGNSAAVTALVEELNTRGIENVCLEEDKWNDVNNITSLFKQFLRKLPEGLVTADLYDGFIEANKKEDSVDRMWALRAMVQELPDHNFETLKLLALHLKLVSENCDKNKMEVRNLAIVFGPTLVRTGDDSMMSLVKDMSDQCRIVETLISECEWFFEESDGDECPIKAPPVCQETVQEDILSHNVLTSLGQVAINFGEDGAYKQKGSGISLHIPKFRSSKTTKSDSGQGSSSDGLMSDSQGSEGSPPMERAPVVRNVSGDGSRSNSPTLERRIVGKRPSDSLPSVQISIEPSDGDFKPKVTGSLKAYSYAHPPPPSYRRTNQRRAASPSPAETPLAPMEATFIPSSDGDIKKSSEESSHDPDNIPKPSFASFSEETRLRLLKMSLQQKAAEKRRQNEIEKQATPPPVDKMDENIPRDTSLDVPRDPSREMSRELPRRASDQESLENVEQLSSSSNSRSSSTPSSKNPSLDSLHVIHQPDKVTGSPVLGSSEAPRVNSAHQLASQPNARPQDMKPRSYETVVAVIQGRGVVAGTARQLEEALRPASSDIRVTRESVEERRLARRSFGSESSDTSSDDDDESALNMNKTFNEKLRMLLDLENTFATEKRGSERDLESYNDSEAFVGSESQKRRVAVEDNSPRLSYEEPSVRTYPGVGGKSLTNCETSVSPTMPSDSHVTIPLVHHESPGLESNSKIVPPTNSADFRLRGSNEELSSGGQTSSTGNQKPVEESPDSSTTRKVGLLRQKFEGGQVRSPRSSVSEDIQLSTKGPPERRKIGSVHTTTPVSLKEFTVKPASVKRNPAQGVSSGQGMPRGTAAAKNQERDESPRRVKTLASKNIRLESSPAKHSSTLPSQYGTPKSEGGNVRSGISINLASSGRSRAQPPVNKTHVPPRVMSWETGNKSKVFSHKESAQELLPSKTTIPTSRDIKSSQTRRKLEKDAQHIADLLQEMHSERDLRLSRQQSDISGQAQKAAAQRAAFRRRRRSLGDGNYSGAGQHPPTSPTERNRNPTVYKTTGPRKGSACHWPSDFEERKRLPNRGSALRTGAHSATR